MSLTTGYEEETMSEIRIATLNDLETLAAIGKTTYIAHFSSIWPIKEEMDTFLQKDFSFSALQQSLIGTSSTWFLVEEGKQTLGFAKVNWDSKMPTSDLTAVELQKIYFLPEVTGKGLGDRLFSKIEELTYERKIPYLWLEVVQSNVAGRIFYQRHGFVVDHEIILKIGTNRIPMWVMVKELTKA